MILNYLTMNVKGVACNDNSPHNLADLLSASESFTTHELNLEVLFKFSLSLIFFRTLHADQHHTAARQS